MTLEAMQQHESVTLHYGPTDFRRVGLVELLRARVEGECVLDMRCLGGELLDILKDQDHEVYGLDGYEVAREDTMKRLAGRIKGSEGAYLWDLVTLPKPLRDQQFDCVICADLLNHVPDDKETLALIRDLLKQGGKLILAVPAYPALEGRRDRSLGHLRRYTKRELRLLLSQHGFRVTSFRPWNFLSLIPYVLLEKLFCMKLNDAARYAAAKPRSTLLGPCLRWWYKKVEVSCPFPIGLSFIVEAIQEKGKSRE